SIVAELVPWGGRIDDPAGVRPLAVARELAADPRIAALSITDNAGGHPRLGPAALAAEFVARGQEVIVHVACRDRSRAALASVGWELAGTGMRNVLCLSGDYPVEGYAGLARPVFDIDSVGLLAMYRELEPGLFLGVAVNNHKRLESEVIGQYLKLALKVRTGARFVISQVGYDARKQDELLRFMRLHGLGALPAIANAYILSRSVARVFHAGRIPGCVVSDDLLALVERQAASPDRGRGFFLELAARQVAIARGLGYAGVYLSGHGSAAEVDHILRLADSFGVDDWRAFAREIRFAQPGEFHYFEADRDGGLNSDEVNRAYRRSLAPGVRRRARRGVPLAYRFSRLTHATAFTPGTAGFRAGRRLYEAAECAHLSRPLHVLEQAAKAPLFDCRDCGDCSLPDMAYLCPESQCAKSQRNGPCGGSADGRCEVVDRPCVWVRAYDRLKPFGEELTMLDRPPAIVDNRLRGTSAWANAFRGRDLIARRAGRPGPEA
ncbi:MAG TPA: methylenetetrahydrofolate reductase C-terminal domain-containing protein, partial [Candidatus Limnocylindrales bacterium]